jgi:serine/threonine protein kinase
MPLIPKDWRVLAGPPSLASCTRDVYDPALRLTTAAAMRIALRVAQGAAHLHARGLLHGDLYAHNILWDGGAGEAVLSDFGAACFLPAGADACLQGIEARAFGLLLGELLAAADDPSGSLAILRDIQTSCLLPAPARRPAMAEIVAAISPHA